MEVSKEGVVENISKQVVVQCFQWIKEDKTYAENKFHIHGYGLNENSESVLVRITDFPPFCRIELPTQVGATPFHWTTIRQNTLFTYLQKRLGDDGPINYNYKKLNRIYYYNEEKYPIMLLTFRTLSAMYKCARLLNKYQTIPGIGNIKLKVHETQIDMITKFLTLSKMRYCQYFQIPTNLVPKEDKVSTSKHEYIIKYKDIVPISNDVVREKKYCTFPRILVFDLECYSNNHKKFPNEFHTLDEIYMISCVLHVTAKTHTRIRYLLIRGKCNRITLKNKHSNGDNVPGDLEVKIIECSTEIDLIQKFCALIRELKPDLITGYNIFGFDYKYMNKRLERKCKEWPVIGKLLGRKAVYTALEWKSKGAGNMDMYFLEIDGIITFDIMKVIKRDYKFLKFSLDFVSRELIGRGKHDVPPKTQFQIYEEHQTAIKLYNGINETTLEEQRVKIVARYEKSVTDMTKVGEYCIEDSELVSDLYEKLSAWFGMTELSNVVGVSPVEIFTRGQQLRCLSLIYRLAINSGFFINQRDNPNISFTGGAVQTPEPGLYDNAVCLDFASLYPSIMIYLNICLSTLVHPIMIGKLDPKKVNVTDFYQDESNTPEADEEDEDSSEKKSKKKPIITKVHRNYQYVKPEVRKGIIPQIVEDLVAERRDVRKYIDGVKDEETGVVIIAKETDPIKAAVLNARQLALKMTANSFFGFLGVHEGGKLPCIEAAMSITAEGRRLIAMVIEFIKKEYNGRIIYGDTDSAMVDLNIKDPKQCNEIGKKLAKEVSDLFPKPLKMEFEKGMKKFFLLKKKMYMYTLVDSEGNTKLDKKGEPIVVIKGFAEARRDRCIWFKKVSKIVRKMIFDEASFEQTMLAIIDEIQLLLNDKVSIEDLVSVRELNSGYKTEGFCTKVFADRLKREGTPVSPGERLDFIVVKTDEDENKLGDKMRDPIKFREKIGTPQEEYIDKYYYVNNMLRGPIDLLLTIGYKDVIEKLDSEKIGYKPLGRKHFRPLDEPLRMISAIILDGESLNIAREIVINCRKTTPKRRIRIMKVN